MAEFVAMAPQRRIKVYKIHRDSDVHNYKELYRFKKENVEWLAQHFLTETTETRGGALSSEEKMRIFLRYIGDPGFQCGVAEDVGVSQSSVSNVIWEVATAVKEKARNWIQFPTSTAALEAAKAEWQERYTFPHAIGAVDCTHVLIRKPHAHGDEYVNRKGVASLNVQVTCNGNERFTSVNVNWPGSVHDARIWKNSNVCRVMTGNNANALLLGDEGYGIAPWLMTPYRNPANAEQRAYNKCITKERVIIERCFGQVKQRFPILQSKIRLSIDRVPSVILCCMILHNVAKHLQEEDYEIPEAENVIGEDDPVPGAVGEQEIMRIRERGQRKRDEIAQIIHDRQQ